MNPTPRKRAVRRGRTALVWALGLFVAGQCGLNAWLHRAHPEMRDLTYEHRLSRLKARLAEAPGRPLVLVVGSSRPANGLSPSALGEYAPHSGHAPLVFNFATLGGGPVRELLTLRRVLAEGIRPDWVLVEVWPAFWAQEGPYCEKTGTLTGDVLPSDLPVLQHLYRTGLSSFSRLCEQILTPALHRRTEVLNAHLPFLVPRNTESDLQWEKNHWRTLDDWGWLPIPWVRDLGRKDDFAFALKHAREATEPSLLKLAMTPGVDWSIRSLLNECRDRGIQVAFFRMPEHSALRGWYTPHTDAVFNGYLRQVQQEYGTPVIDARDWVSDDDFVDFSHLLPRGAVAFSSRFGPEVLRPLLEGRPLPPRLLLHTEGTKTGTTSDPGTPPTGP